MMESQKALIIVDVQNDFCPGGALPVSDGDLVVPALNKYIEVFSDNNWPIFASRDWHPKETKHFKTFGGQWPPHCVQDTEGAMFHPKLKLPLDAIILSKGVDPNQDGYSAFEAMNDQGEDLLSLLKGRFIQKLFVGGLATDYCVRSTVLEGLKDFDVYLLMDAIKGVNINPDDSKKAIDEMATQGAKRIDFNEFTKTEF